MFYFYFSQHCQEISAYNNIMYNAMVSADCCSMFYVCVQCTHMYCIHYTVYMVQIECNLSRRSVNYALLTNLR